MAIKKCALILPYFGTFNNYFQMFLNSVGKNKIVDLLLFTDNECKYDIPDNVKIYKTTLQEIKKIAQEKFGFEISLNRAYKLCDLKPMYGFLFEEYLNDYEFWGHCDCDLIFGNIDNFLSDILNQDYDKIFSAGHLTIYKNNYENNRTFMNSIRKPMYYKEVLKTDDIVIFDENFAKGDYSDKYNIHIIFQENNKKIFCKDLSFNATQKSGKFVRSYYCEHKQKFIWEDYCKSRYYWDNGNVVRIKWDDNLKQIITQTYLYIHLQCRKMRLPKDCLNTNLYEILPDRFRKVDKIPVNYKNLKMISINWSYLYWFDVYYKKVNNKLKSIINKFF